MVHGHEKCGSRKGNQTSQLDLKDEPPTLSKIFCEDSILCFLEVKSEATAARTEEKLVLRRTTRTGVLRPTPPTQERQVNAQKQVLSGGLRVATLRNSEGPKDNISIYM
jgi:hypothetical protein